MVNPPVTLQQAGRGTIGPLTFEVSINTSVIAGAIGSIVVLGTFGSMRLTHMLLTRATRRPGLIGSRFTARAHNRYVLPSVALTALLLPSYIGYRLLRFDMYDRAQQILNLFNRISLQAECRTGGTIFAQIMRETADT